VRRGRWCWRSDCRLRRRVCGSQRRCGSARRERRRWRQTADAASAWRWCLRWRSRRAHAGRRRWRRQHRTAMSARCRCAGRCGKISASDIRRLRRRRRSGCARSRSRWRNFEEADSRLPARVAAHRHARSADLSPAIFADECVHELCHRHAGLRVDAAIVA
jgi:hypothetical protein